MVRADQLTLWAQGCHILKTLVFAILVILNVILVILIVAWWGDGDLVCSLWRR